MPWMIAVFLAMVWLVPIDSIQLTVNTPVDLKLDRLFLLVMAITWIASVFAGGQPTPRWRGGAIDALVIAFVGVAIISVLGNLLVIVHTGESDLALKKLTLLGSYVTFFFICATTIRPRELPRFAVLFMSLAAITAVEALYEYHTHTNLFFDWSRSLLPSSLAQVHAVPYVSAYGLKAPITGPCRHALALAAMFAMSLSFALVALLHARTSGKRWLYTIVSLLMLGGIFSTGRHTGAIAGLVAVLIVTAYRWREMARIAPGIIVVLMIVTALTPRAVNFQVNRLDPATITTGASAQGRSSDYKEVAPDIRAHVVTGRGYGTYDPFLFRILDNNYLLLMLEVGLLGTGVFVALILSVPWTAHRTIKARDPMRSPYALAAAAGTGAFAAAMALFDAMSFVQVTYLFFFLAAVVLVCRLPRDAKGDLSLGAAAVRDPDVMAPRRGEIHGERTRVPQRRTARRPGTVPAAERTPRPAARPRRGLPETIAGRGDRFRGRAGLTRIGGGVLAVLFALAAFSRGGGSSHPLPALGSAKSGDDLGLGEFAGPAAHNGGHNAHGAPQTLVAQAQPARSLPGTSTRVSAVQPSSAPTTPSRPRAPKPARPQGHHAKPTLQLPTSSPQHHRPGGAQHQPATPPPSTPVVARDCLPPDVEKALAQLGIDPCQKPDQIQQQIQQLVSNGTLPAPQARQLLVAFSVAQGAAPGAAKQSAADVIAAVDTHLPKLPS